MTFQASGYNTVPELYFKLTSRFRASNVVMLRFIYLKVEIRTWEWRQIELILFQLQEAIVSYC